MNNDRSFEIRENVFTYIHPHPPRPLDPDGVTRRRCSTRDKSEANSV